VAETPVAEEAAANPFADDSAQDDNAATDDAAEEAVEVAPTPVAGDGSSPLTSLENIKAEIAGFVATHNQNVADYKDQIKGLEGKIKEEKELLKSRKAEFRAMLGEIEALTEDFGGQDKKQESQKQQNEEAQSKPKKKRNRKKKSNPEQNKEQNA